MAQLYANPQYVKSLQSAAAGPTPRDWAALLAIGAVASLLLMFSARYCNTQTADSVMFVFASLEKLTWYYWGQDRLLNVVPAITSFIRDPEMNLSAQLFLRFMSAIALPVVFCVCTSEAMMWRAVIAGIAASALMIFNYSGFSDASWFYNGDSYALALLFAVAGTALWLRDDWRLKIAAAALIILAYPVNISLAVSAACFACGLLVLFPALFWSHRYVVAVHAAAALLGLLHSRLFGTSGWPTEPGILLSLSGLGKSIANIYGDTGIMTWTSPVGIAILAYRWLFSARADVDRIWIGLGIGGLVAIVATSQLTHVARNFYLGRYFLIPVSVITIVSVLAIVEQMWSCVLSAVPAWTRYPTFLGTGMILASIYITHGGLNTGPHLLADRFYANAVQTARLSVDSGSSIIVGEYWTTWAAAFERLILDYRAKRHGLVYVATSPPRGRVMKDEFLSELQNGKSMNVLCMLASANECLDAIRRYLEVPVSVRLALRPGVIDHQYILTPATELGDGDLMQRVSFEHSDEFEINFGQSGNSAQYVDDDHWAGPEPWGQWTDARQAALFFSIATPGNLDFALTVGPLLSAERPKQSVSIYANQCRIGSFDFDLSYASAPHIISGTIPANCINADGKVVLRIDTDGVRTPKAIGINDDERTLGVRVERLVLRNY